MDMLLRRLSGGQLVAADDETAERIQRIKAGAVLRGDFKKMRNPQFFRKWWALVGLAYDMWTERLQPQEYRGLHVMPNKDRFRKDLIILAGYYDATYNIKGEVRLEAKSISFDSMEEDEFEGLYSKTIDVIIHRILPNAGYNERTLRAAVNEIMEFA